MPLTLSVLEDRLAVCKLPPADAVPAWADAGGLSSITRTREELSIVCAEERVPAGVKTESGWRCLKVEGPLDFGLTGILVSIAKPLAEARVSIFALSTFDTDYVMVKEANLRQAIEALRAAGHEVRD